MKTVVFVIDTFSNGGAERIVRLIANRLSDLNYKIIVIILKKKETTYFFDERIIVYNIEDYQIHKYLSKVEKKLAHVYKYVNIIHKRVKRKLFGQSIEHIRWENSLPFIYSYYTLPIKEILANEKDLCIFSFLSISQIAVGLLPKKEKVNKVFCERNSPQRDSLPFEIKMYRDKYFLLYNNAVYQTFVQKEYYDILKPMGKVIFNPITTDLPKRVIGARKKNIVNFCRLDKQKNIPLLIDAFDAFHKSHLDYVLYIYGDGSEKLMLLNYIQQKGLEKYVYIKPFSTSIHAEIVDFAMFVSTSDWEGMSNSMLEAMAIGLPTICTDCDGGGARAIIKDHDNGILVPKGDKQAICIAMTEIADNQKLAETLSVNAEKIREELCLDKIIDEWIKMI